MSYKMWQRRFNLDPSILGKTFILNGKACTLVGIMPKRFTKRGADLWQPAELNRADDREAPGPPSCWFIFQGRLKPGVALKPVETDLLPIAQRWEEAARAVGISTRTLLRWLKLPEFQKAYREARRQAFGQFIARLQQATSAAAAALMKVMVDPNAPAFTRVRAADSIFNDAARAIEIEDIEARVSELERAAGVQKSVRASGD
jgi:hypothetical protein